ncbi:MAG: hypothetical protein V4685_01940 [Bacteroidota bacterium]
MRSIISFFLFVIIATSCSKEKAATAPPVNLPDTLSTGWSIVKVEEETFSDIFFNNNTTGFACAAGAIYRSADGGSSWQKVFTGGTGGWNIKGTADGKLFVAKANNTLLCSFDGGNTFENIVVPAVPGYNNIFDLSFINNNTGYVVMDGSLLSTTDGGHTWAQAGTITSPSTSGYSYGFPFFLNETTGWVAIGSKIYRTNGSVNNWIQSSFLDSLPGGEIMQPFASSRQTVYLLTCRSKTQLFKSTNGGTSFSLIKNFDASSYSTVHFVDDNNGYVANGKKIYATHDGGATWLTEVALGDEFFSELYFTDADHGWACTTKGVIVVFKR